MSRFKTVLSSIGILVGIIIFVFSLELGGLSWKRFFAPKHENIRREVFEATRSYNEAKLQDLVRYRLQYERATTVEEKEILASAMRHMFANYDKNKLPYDLSLFLDQIMKGQK